MRLLPSWNRKSDKQVKIPWSIYNAHIVSESKSAIKDAEPRKALDILAGLENPQLDAHLTHLTNQLARYRRENIQGTQAFDEKNVTFNRITARILDLINTIEESLAFEEKEYKEVKDYLRQRYQNRLNQKLAGRQPVNLRRLPSTEGTSEETSAIFKSFGVDEIRDEITKAFHDTQGRLLIVGKPGAGKTVLMLQLVIRLLDTEKDALPVVLNLASWQSSFGRLENWLEKIIPSELGVNTNFAKKITEQYRLILLLDGFDEVKEEERLSCLVSIGKYGADAGRQFVIASRINEYKAVAADAPVYGQIEVGPLTIEQIETELERVGHDQPEALRLLNAIRKDELLREAVQTPFYFNTMQLMFADGKRWPDFGFSAGTVEGRQREIIEPFVTSELEGQGDDKYTSEQTRHWLSFFADRMNRHNLVVFELRDLQYEWWEWSKKQSYWAGFVATSVISLPFELFLMFTFGFLFWLLSSYMMWFLIGIILGTVLWLSFVFYYVHYVLRQLPIPVIMTIDQLKWSWEIIIRGSKIMWRPILFLIVIINLFFLGYKGVSNIQDKFHLIILFALLFIPLSGVFILLLERSSFSHFLQINTPYQRFAASLKSLHFSIVEHFLLRYQLHRQGLLPFRLVDFLNDMSTRHFLETDGATWRFRHRLIQDYFAGMWEESNEKIEPDTSKADAT